MTTTVKKRSIIPWYFVWFFGFIAIVNAIMVYLAVGSFTGVVSEHSYQEGLAYNDVLEKSREQAELGWKTKISISPGSSGHTSLSINLQDKNGKAVHSAKVKARFYRPTLAGYDQTFNLIESNKGQYKAAVTLPLPGLWEIHVQAQKEHATIQTFERVVIE
jgi:nitrogen fixation protein FixH